MSPSAIQHNLDNAPAHIKTAAQPPSEPDFSTFRSLVPLVADDNLTYLNASYQPPCNPIVHAAIVNFTSEGLYNPHPNRQWQSDVEDARALLGRYINADRSSIAFTRDTTEALVYFIWYLKIEPGDDVVVTDANHPNHVHGWMILRSAGVEVRQVPTIPEAQRTGDVVAATGDVCAVRRRPPSCHRTELYYVPQRTVERRPRYLQARGIHILADLT